MKLYVDLETESEKVQCLKKNISMRLRQNNWKYAAVDSRDLGKILYRHKNYIYALEQFEWAANYNNRAGLYLREIQDRLYCIEVLQLLNNDFEVAKTFSKVAALFAEKLADKGRAMHYFLFSALAYEKIGNYFACHKMAYQAYECCNKKADKVAMLNIAVRASIKQHLYQKIIFYIDKLFDVCTYSKTDPTYLSLCTKGYHAAKHLGDLEKVVYYLSPLISNHCECNNKQANIKDIAKDYLFACIKTKRTIDDLLINLINNVYEENLEKANILNDLGLACEEVGLIDDERTLKIYANDTRKEYYKKNRKFGSYCTYAAWKVTSDYGESLSRWSAVSVLIVLFFAIAYYIVPVGAFSDDLNLIKSIYFSCVTFTTLGYGDVYPITGLTQIMVIFEVIIGYMMLGGLVSIFSKRVIR